MRIRVNVAPYCVSTAVETGEPGTALAIDAILARSFIHRRLWLNDPDCLMLRAKETRLTIDEREALAWTIAASGGMLLISDDMNLLDGESAKLFQALARIGLEVDASSSAQPPLVADLMSDSPITTLSAATAAGELQLILNMSDVTRRVETHSLELAPHSAHIVRTSKK
jgi:alpha-galactosidase